MMARTVTIDSQPSRQFPWAAPEGLCPHLQLCVGAFHFALQPLQCGLAAPKGLQSALQPRLAIRHLRNHKGSHVAVLL